MAKKALPKKFIQRAQSITNKRARVVIDHILKHGFITTDYLHVALQSIRRLDILWQHEEVKKYEKVKVLAARDQKPLPDFVKKILDKHVS